MSTKLSLCFVLFLLFSAVSKSGEVQEPTWKQRWTESVFDRVDLNDDGFISKAEAARSKGSSVSVQVPFDAVDSDHDEKISRKEFVKAVQNSKKVEFHSEDRDSDLGMPYRPKQGRESTQDLGLKFKF